MFCLIFFIMYLECSPDHTGLQDGPRPKNQDGGVRVSILQNSDKNLC